MSNLRDSAAAAGVDRRQPEDPAHCGGCGRACASGEVCVAGVCTANCPAGETRCDGRCTRIDTDGLHCGACGNACPMGQGCVAGRCAVTCDAPGSMVRECAVADGLRYCADVASDRRNCGACGTRCVPGQVCETGRCVAACPEGQQRCGGRCVDPLVDPMNCGACGTACPAGHRCVTGRGGPTCPAGQTVCAPVLATRPLYTSDPA